MKRCSVSKVSAIEAHEFHLQNWYISACKTSTQGSGPTKPNQEFQNELSCRKKTRIIPVLHMHAHICVHTVTHTCLHDVCRFWVQFRMPKSKGCSCCHQERTTVFLEKQTQTEDICATIAVSGEPENKAELLSQKESNEEERGFLKLWERSPVSATSFPVQSPSPVRRHLTLPLDVTGSRKCTETSRD